MFVMKLYVLFWLMSALHTRRNHFMQKNGSVPDVLNKRKSWEENITGLNAENLVFLDESGVNTDMTRLYGRSLSKERVIDSTPINTPSTTTILSSIQLNGTMFHTTYTGETTAQRFRDYLENVLCPQLDENKIIIMDNMKSHHAKIVKEFLESKKVKYLSPPRRTVLILIQ